MFNRREICFAILLVAVGSVSAVNCPKNETCSCKPNEFGHFEIFCQVNDSSIEIIIIPGQLIKVTCSNSKWSDFYLHNITRHATRTISFYMCDLPNNSSLKTITEMLGTTDVQNLIFRSYKNLTSFKRLHLKGFRNLYYLDLSFNHIFYMDQDLLADLPKLRSLKLIENNLRNITLLLKYVSQLQTLNLGYNILQSIEPGTFDSLTNLTTLSLQGNDLSELPSGIFDKLVKLKNLNLCCNYLVDLPENIFGKLKNLEELILAINNFTSLPDNLLKNNTKLRLFYLDFNKKQLDTLPGGFFSNLTELETLRLETNGFIFLPEDLLWGCFSLTTLILSGNYLDDLPGALFRDLTNLTELKIDSNKFEKLPRTFSFLHSLRKLDASNNHISSIIQENEIFFALNKLEELNMAQNFLREIPDFTFIFGCITLKIANFANNYLTLNQKSHFFVEDVGIYSPFAFCSSLEELYLANNRISDIFTDWNFRLSNLQKLDLKHNYISSLSVENLQFVSKNIEVDLRYNKIQHIFLNDAEEFLKHDGPHRAVILIDNNPLHCGCEIYDFLRYLEGKMDPSVTRYLSIIPENLTCYTPFVNKTALVTNLRSESLMCETKKSVFASICPKKCNCTKQHEQNVFIMNCTHNDFISMPNITRKPLGFKKIELDFYNNRLTQMPNLTELSFGPVSKLILSYNKISEITLDGLSKTIEILKLNNNNISKISPTVLNFLRNFTNLTSMTLQKNPWICDCSTTDFLDFIQRKHKIITDLQNVTCYGKDTLISNMSMTDFCPINNEEQSYEKYISMIMFVFVGFIVSISGLFCYKYPHSVTYIQPQLTVLKEKLFSHRSILENELEDEEKLFDAFVSYSQDDHDFVTNELVRELENGSMPLKLCLPYRDWQAGEWTTANILKSVESSRRIIVVLSPSFLENIWEKTEFRITLCQALCTDQSDVILILYGNIGPTDEHLLLDPILKTYIDANTYIKWGDPGFWNKLRQFLQHNFKFSANHSEPLLRYNRVSNESSFS